MFDILKVFYPTHYNFAALSILLVITIIWLLTKKNYKWSLIFFAVLLAFNIAIYKRTEGKSWTISFDESKNTSDMHSEGPTYTFSALKNWSVTDSQGKTYHWCWVEDWWSAFSGMDLIATIWGENKSKKMMKASEQRFNDVPAQ